MLCLLSADTCAATATARFLVVVQRLQSIAPHPLPRRRLSGRHVAVWASARRHRKMPFLLSMMLLFVLPLASLFVVLCAVEGEGEGTSWEERGGRVSAPLSTPSAEAAPRRRFFVFAVVGERGARGRKEEGLLQAAAAVAAADTGFRPLAFFMDRQRCGAEAVQLCTGAHGAQSLNFAALLLLQ